MNNKNLTVALLHVVIGKFTSDKLKVILFKLQNITKKKPNNLKF